MKKVLAIVFLAVLAASGSSAQAKDPLLGAWRLNRARSTYDPGPAPASRTMKFEAVADGIRHVTETYVNNGSGTDEGVHIADYTARFDGTEAVIRGSALDTVSLKRVNARTVERTGKVGKVAVEMQTWSLSADGRTLTLTTKGSNDGDAYSRVEVFERQ